MRWLLLVLVLMHYAGIIDRDNRTARVSFQFQHTVIAAAAAVAARCEAAAVLSVGAPGVLGAERACAVAMYAERSSSISSTRRQESKLVPQLKKAKTEAVGAAGVGAAGVGAAGVGAGCGFCCWTPAAIEVPLFDIFFTIFGDALTQYR